ncbi:MAG: Kiwa anti-phage protein KwaB-like domain-containing protein [Actinomycetota bacterium]
MVNHLRFYAAVVTDADQQATFFRSYGPKKELSRKGGFALTKGQGQYNRIKKKVFLFDDQVDCFTWEGFLFIRNPYQFRRIFRYLEQLKERANEIIDLVTERVPISNEDEFRSAVAGQMQMLAKVSSIAAKPYLSELTMEAIQLTIDEFELDLEVVVEDDEDKLVFDPAPDKRWIILKLLDDVYLESVMTDLKYESNSKISRSST